MFLREAQEQPLVLIFEDLHWIDGETQALLDSLVESLPTARLLLLVNYRPEYSHAWGSKTYYRQLRIDPLPPESAEDLLNALLGSNDALAPLRRLLIQRTEANPLYLEESAQDLGMRPAVAHGHLGLGRFYRRAGKGEPGREHLTTAISLYREMGMPYWLEQAELEQREPQ